MAAREGFEKHWLYAFMLRRMGCFSVDREGADIAATEYLGNAIQAMLGADEA